LLLPAAPASAAGCACCMTNPGSSLTATFSRSFWRSSCLRSVFSLSAGAALTCLSTFCSPFSVRRTQSASASSHNANKPSGYIPGIIHALYIASLPILTLFAEPARFGPPSGSDCYQPLWLPLRFSTATNTLRHRFSSTSLVYHRKTGDDFGGWENGGGGWLWSMRDHRYHRGSGGKAHGWIQDITNEPKINLGPPILSLASIGGDGLGNQVSARIRSYSIPFGSEVSTRVETT
jgi:hypothetical protein